MEKKIGENVSSGAEKVERIERERTRPQTDAPEKAQHERQPDGAGAKGAPSKKKETETAAERERRAAQTRFEAAKARAAYALARYFVSDEGAKVFFDATKYGVTNLTVVEDPAYSSNKFNVALGEMVAAGRTVGQGVSVTDDFWTPMTNFGDCIVNNAKTASQWGDYASVEAAVTGILGDSKGWSIHA